jgi:hypothetical protein
MQLNSSSDAVLFPLRLRQIDPVLAEFRRTRREPAPGDLKGLQRMIRERKARRMMKSTTAINDDRRPIHVGMTGREFEAALRTLPESAQREIEAELRQIAEDQKS